MAGATCVPQFSTLTVRFNAGAGPSNFTASNFTVTGPNGNVSGAATFDTATNTATFIVGPGGRQTPEAFGAVTTYTATINGFSGGPFTWSFSTGPCNEVIPAYSASYTQIDVPGASHTNAFGINNLGDVVGEFADANGTHGYLLTNGVFTTIDFPGANKFTRANKINDNGDIVGEYAAPNGVLTGFLLHAGTFTSIAFPDPNVFATEANGINTAGTIVGRANFTNSTAHGYVRDPNGTFRLFDAPNSITGGNFAKDINNNGDIVGVVGGNVVGYIATGGTSFTTFNVPTSGDTEANGVNDTQQITGLWTSSNKPLSGFFKSGSTFFDVVVPDSTNVQAQDTNNTGVVVGIFSTVEGSAAGDHGFIARPR
ncbi:MAG: hypothetical protein JWO13_2184 [Acidobacteriales bacterium]|nr:hypothetical protein [Terriglobales bacterium]